MMINLTSADIGKSFKTRGGWRAQICDVPVPNSILVYHSETQDLELHSKNGAKKHDSILRNEDPYNLFEPWKEPVRETVPEGYKMVPIEPTIEMDNAFHECDMGWKRQYLAMLTAAPTPDREGA